MGKSNNDNIVIMIFITSIIENPDYSKRELGFFSIDPYVFNYVAKSIFIQVTIYIVLFFF
jgi:hypothetical protein